MGRTFGFAHVCGERARGARRRPRASCSDATLRFLNARSADFVGDEQKATVECRRWFDGSRQIKEDDHGA
jgi:hypothetical protein